MHKLLILFISIIGLVGCDSQPPNYITPESNILIFGDNYTYGQGVSEAYSYPKVLEKNLSRKVINASENGLLAANLKNKVESTIEIIKRNKNKIGLAIIMIGSNDIRRDYDTRYSVKGIDESIQIIKSRNIPILFITMNTSNKSTLNPMYVEIKNKHPDIYFETEIFRNIIANQKYIQGPVELNTDGYYELSMSIEKWLKNNGFVKKW